MKLIVDILVSIIEEVCLFISKGIVVDYIFVLVKVLSDKLGIVVFIN